MAVCIIPLTGVAQSQPNSRQNDGLLSRYIVSVVQPWGAYIPKPTYTPEPDPPEAPRIVLAETFGWVWGNCTYYVAERRSEAGEPVTWRGDARYWARNAESQGYIVTDEPSVGAIYVATDENSRGTLSGHVAYVERIEGERVLISEMNYIGLNRVSYRWITRLTLASRGVRFIL